MRACMHVQKMQPQTAAMSSLQERYCEASASVLGRIAFTAQLSIARIAFLINTCDVQLVQ